MNDSGQGAQTDGPFFPGPLHSASGILAARQTLQYRLGPPLTMLGGLILLIALITALELGRVASIAILAGAAAVAMALVAYERSRSRHHGIWAKPSGEPSLGSPSTESVPDPKATAWVRLVGLILAASLAAGGYLYGAAFDTLLFWIIAYGIVHMVVYTLSLWLNLGLREQAVAVVWFIVGGLYWVSTGSSLALLFGGFALTGLLLWRRLRRLEKLAHPSTASDHSEGAK